MDEHTADGQALKALYTVKGKHTIYQQVHPLVAVHLPDQEVIAPGKLDIERQAYFERALTLRGARVLDIGCNSGYFTFGALQAGARHVTCYEGHTEHANFVKYGAELAGLSERVTVHPSYFDFQPAGRDPFDVIYCLNVLHHLGDDFGDASLNIDAARQQMLCCLAQMASMTRTLMLQLGFNWKGDVRHPLFEGGEKAALIDFVAQGSADHWLIEEVTVPHPVSKVYERISADNLPRNNQIGEFMNRPLFKMRSRVPQR
jgi:SAM-dependent methyltransferase